MRSGRATKSGLLGETGKDGGASGNIDQPIAATMQ